MTPSRDDRFEGREPRRYEMRFLVTEDDIDGLGHVNNVVYVDWIQRVAGEHWRAAADPELRERVAWVVSRHEIDYKRPAYAGEEVTVRTWVGSTTGVRFERHVEIVDAAERTLVRARTIWSPLDRETGRLMRLDASAHEPFYD
ncbi:MAG: acyl-CoA thioesterase [Gemmatimonadota bacterium]|nr:acyl-CoA thioesterase [Gemmatimonadota bacterium]